MSEIQPLLQPITLGAVQLKNRVIMAPLTRCRATNEHQAPDQKHIDYYTQRAGAGLIISEGSEVSKKARGYAFVVGIFNDAQIEGRKKVVDSVHQAREGTVKSLQGMLAFSWSAASEDYFDIRE